MFTVSGLGGFHGLAGFFSWMIGVVSVDTSSLWMATETAILVGKIGAAVKQVSRNQAAGCWWYSPHMAAASRAIAERIPLVDLVLEVRDARVGYSPFVTISVCCFSGALLYCVRWDSATTLHQSFCLSFIYCLSPLLAVCIAVMFGKIFLMKLHMFIVFAAFYLFINLAVAFRCLMKWLG